MLLAPLLVACHHTTDSDGVLGAKFERNVRHDAETTALLEAAGWTVLRYWEHDDPAILADGIRAVVMRSDDGWRCRTSSPGGWHADDGLFLWPPVCAWVGRRGVDHKAAGRPP